MKKLEIRKRPFLEIWSWKIGQIFPDVRIQKMEVLVSHLLNVFLRLLLNQKYLLSILSIQYSERSLLRNPVALKSLRIRSFYINLLNIVKLKFHKYVLLICISILTSIYVISISYLFCIFVCLIDRFVQSVIHLSRTRWNEKVWKRTSRSCMYNPSMPASMKAIDPLESCFKANHWFCSWI